MTLKGLWTACFSGRHPRLASCESNGIPTRDTGAASELAALDSASPGESGDERGIAYTPKQSGARRRCSSLALSSKGFIEATDDAAVLVKSFEAALLSSRSCIPSCTTAGRGNVIYTSADQLVKDVQELKWLGQGAQGVVYEGIWQGAAVAVKFSIVEKLDTHAWELLFSKMLSHPNVVQTFVVKVAVLDEKAIRPLDVSAANSGSLAVLYPQTQCVGAWTAQRSSHLGGGMNSMRLTRGSTDCSQSAATAAAAAAALGCSGPLPPQHADSQATGSATGSSRNGTSTGGRGGSGGGSGGAAGPRLQPRGTSTCGGGTASTGGAQANSSDLQRQVVSRADSFNSDDGFGDPFARKNTFADVRDVLAGMGAKAGHYITQMVMEHCDHGSLHAAIQRGIFKPTSRWGPKLALRALIRTLREVAQGMFHLHSNSVVHGDLKPANVLLINSRKDRRGYVAKVSDFGLAQFCSTCDHVSNAPWGTLVYMAPERLMHGQMFPAGDVYAFGIMLWEMYHGARPFEGMHAAQIVMAGAQGTLRLQWPADAPEDLVRLYQQCTAPSPHDRPTFEVLMRDLALLESRVRVEGARISRECSRQSSRHSVDLPRGMTNAAVAPSRASLDSNAHNGPNGSAAAGYSRRISHDRDRVTTSKSRLSVDVTRTGHSHAPSPRALQPRAQGAPSQQLLAALSGGGSAALARVSSSQQQQQQQQQQQDTLSSFRVQQLLLQQGLSPAAAGGGGGGSGSPAQSLPSGVATPGSAGAAAVQVAAAEGHQQSPGMSVNVNGSSGSGSGSGSSVLVPSTPVPIAPRALGPASVCPACGRPASAAVASMSHAGGGRSGSGGGACATCGQSGSTALRDLSSGGGAAPSGAALPQFAPLRVHRTTMSVSGSSSRKPRPLRESSSPAALPNTKGGEAPLMRLPTHPPLLHLLPGAAGTADAEPRTSAISAVPPGSGTQPRGSFGYAWVPGPPAAEQAVAACLSAHVPSDAYVSPSNSSGANAGDRVAGSGSALLPLVGMGTGAGSPFDGRATGSLQYGNGTGQQQMMMSKGMGGVAGIVVGVGMGAGARGVRRRPSAALNHRTSVVTECPTISEEPATFGREGSSSNSADTDQAGSGGASSSRAVAGSASSKE